MLTHSNLLHNAALVYRAVQHTPEDSYVSWLPTFHDMGFMAGVLQPLFAGIPAVLLSPASFLQSPLLWLKAISTYKATISGGPNFAYDLCVRKISPEQREELDLSHWTVAFNGAEPIRPETIEGFASAFKRSGFRKEAFYPCYGLAEATLIVSGGLKAEPPIIKNFDAKRLESNLAAETAQDGHTTRPLVSCGRTLSDQHIVIAHPESCVECAPGEVGEIWVGGQSIAQGYWNQPEQSRQTFKAYLAVSGEGPFLRTGDVGFMKDGELFVTGRLKDLIIIRGVNHYPQDIELTVEKCHPALRPGCCAAFSINVDGVERLVIVQEIDHRKRPDPDSIVDAIRHAISSKHELQAHSIALIRAGSIPKTSSGKIQRHACKAAFLEGSLEQVASSALEDAAPAPAEDSFIRKALLAVDLSGRQPLLELYLQDHLSRLLRLPAARLNTHSPLTSYGLDSLSAVELKNYVERELGVKVSLARLLQGISISDLARDSVGQLGAGTPEPRGLALASPRQPEHPLSFIQQSLWFIHQLAPESSAYNIHLATRLLTHADDAQLRQAFQTIVDRHASLRTTFTSRPSRSFTMTEPPILSRYTRAIGVSKS
jgi:acyl-coenzyme A synthetase/AMP-(fatty) acid ligase/acyl carrier protein